RARKLFPAKPIFFLTKDWKPWNQNCMVLISAIMLALYQKQDSTLGADPHDEINGVGRGATRSRAVMPTSLWRISVTSFFQSCKQFFSFFTQDKNSSEGRKSALCQSQQNYTALGLTSLSRLPASSRGML